MHLTHTHSASDGGTGSPLIVMLIPRRYRVVVVVVVLVVVGSYLVSYRRRGGSDVTTAVAAGPASRRSVTKSLAELSGATAVPELSDHVVLFNRVPKTGSEMLVLLLQWLQGVNGFRHIRLPGGNERRLQNDDQASLVEDIVRQVREEAVPVTFDRHVYFLNFTRFGRQSPVFINLVRNPEDKAMSRFYYRRATPSPKINSSFAPRRTTRQFKSSTFEECLASGDEECRFVDGKPYDLSIPYFCGHEQYCMFLNDEKALKTAKENVERYYPVVGVLEQLNATLATLEKKLPYFFKGVQDMYYNELLQPHKNKNRKRPREVSAEARTYLKATLKTEYDFYDWVTARLLTQFRQL